MKFSKSRQLGSRSKSKHILFGTKIVSCVILTLVILLSVKVKYNASQNLDDYINKLHSLHSPPLPSHNKSRSVDLIAAPSTNASFTIDGIHQSELAFSKPVEGRRDDEKVVFEEVKMKSAETNQSDAAKVLEAKDAINKTKGQCNEIDSSIFLCLLDYSHPQLHPYPTTIQHCAHSYFLQKEGIL